MNITTQKMKPFKITRQSTGWFLKDGKTQIFLGDSSMSEDDIIDVAMDLGYFTVSF
jgi:hypothetical protein